MTESHWDGVYCCSGIKWDWYGGQYGIGLDLKRQGGIVVASFDCAALGILVEHCNKGYAAVSKPEGFKGLLFEVRFDGNLCRAIRIHPAYGHKRSWLKAGIRVIDHDYDEQMREQLEFKEV